MLEKEGYETHWGDFGVCIQLESIICTDNNQAFVSFLKTQKFDDYESLSYLNFQRKLLKLICFCRAIRCATALLNGETGLPARDDLNTGLSHPLERDVDDKSAPLQIAAKMLCYGLTQLFIEQGADPCFNGIESRFFISLLPLNLALDAFCQHKIVKDRFPAGESVYKLFSLLRLQELKEALDTIKLLASRTEQVMILGVCCVEEWNLVKLVGLLIAAWDKLAIEDDIYSCPIAKLIGLQHGLESDLEKKQIARSMLQAFKLVRYFLEEAEHVVGPLEVANKFPTEVKLIDEGTHMVSADLDRLAAELFRWNKDLLETTVVEKNCSNVPSIEDLSGTSDLHRWAPLLRLGDKVLLETRLVKKMSSISMLTEEQCIFYCPCDPERDIEETWGDSFYDRLSRALYHDDRHEFVKVVNGLNSFIESCSIGSKDTLPNMVIENMFFYDSANCAAAVLAGETDTFLTFRDLTEVGGSLLHKAAECGDPNLTALFLENGLLADDGRDCHKLQTKAASPFAVALESIRDHFSLRDWKDNQSVIDLVVLLCRDEFRNTLETIRLLLKTRIVCDEFSLYFKEGKMVEMCALLMVAHKEILASDLVVDTLVPSPIIHKARDAGHMRHFSTSTRRRNSHEDDDPLERNGTLLLLDIFRKIGDYLSAYIRLEPMQSEKLRNSQVAWLIASAGISDAPVPKITKSSISPMYLADNKRVLLGRVNCYSVEQDSGPKSSYQRNSQLPWLIARVGISTAPVSKIAHTSISSRMYLADNKRLLGRVNCYSVEQDCGSKMTLQGQRRTPTPHGVVDKQASMKMSWTQGTASSTLFARPLRRPVPKLSADFASLVSAKRLVDGLRYRHPPMCSSIVAALASGFKRR